MPDSSLRITPEFLNFDRNTQFDHWVIDTFWTIGSAIDSGRHLGLFDFPIETRNALRPSILIRRAFGSSLDGFAGSPILGLIDDNEGKIEHLPWQSQGPAGVIQLGASHEPKPLFRSENR